ncbi:MAG: hypothetical protein HRU41_09050 [Saprospiraceae bacterium]|nr:hypothetical protein [Saprospiraceae bacterium]
MTQQLSSLISANPYTKELNTLIANLQVYRQKLLHYDWNARSRKLPEIQVLLNDLYLPDLTLMDALVQELLASGAKPLSSLEQFLRQAELKEGRNFLDAKCVSSQLNKDLHVISQNAHRALLLATEKKQEASQKILRLLTKLLSKDMVVLQGK